MTRKFIKGVPLCRCERQMIVEEECGPDKFRCTSGECVNGVWYCDGREVRGKGDDLQQHKGHGAPYISRLKSQS